VKLLESPNGTTPALENFATQQRIHRKPPTMTKTKFKSIARNHLSEVIGGVTRASGASTTDQTTQMQMMLSQIGDSIKSLASNQNSSSSSSMMPMMMMMMMGGGSQGGGSSAPPPPPPPAPAPAGTFVKVNVK
jgi:hypothetical protein